METIEATFKVVTPMFISGADQDKAELRLPSIKGALRFWWRALAWDRFGDLKTIREEEAKLFGSTDTGQAAVLMSLSNFATDPLKKGEVLHDGNHDVGAGARYFGYGVMDTFDGKNSVAGRLTRPCLSPPFKFTLRLCFRPRHLLDQQKDSVLQAIKAVGLFGNLGSKSRKGYGSIILESLQIDEQDAGWAVPKNADEYVSLLSKLNLPSFDRESTEKLPEYTAFTSRTRILILQDDTEKSSLNLLHRIGRDLVFFRSWGRKGEVMGQNSEKNFKPDHDLMKNLSSKVTYPERVVFGLPHNYGKPERLHVKPQNYDRRASPLFIHIHQADGSTPIVNLSFLPAQFLPENEKLHVLGRPVELSPNNLWKPIHDFLDRLLDSNQGKEQFANAMEVTP